MCYCACLFAAKPRQNTIPTTQWRQSSCRVIPCCPKLASADATNAREEARNLRGGYWRAGRCRRKMRGRANRRQTARVAAARQRRRAPTRQAAGKGSGRGMAAGISAPREQPWGDVAAQMSGGGRGERRPAAGRPGRSAPWVDALHGWLRGNVTADEWHGEGERGPPPRRRP